MFPRLTTLLSLFSILINFPAVVAVGTSPTSVITNGPKTCASCPASAQPEGLDRLEVLSNSVVALGSLRFSP
jgi:hypothetical protein